MFSRTLLQLSALSFLAIAPLSARAEPADPAAPTAAATVAARATDPAAHPVITGFLPAELAFLRSNASLFINYSHIDALFGANTSGDLLLLGVDANISLADRLQLGLRLPFVQHGSASNGLSNTSVGDLQLRVKGQLWRSPASGVAVAAFVNGLLPTASDARGREYGFVQPGLAVSARTGLLTAGFSGSALIVFRGGGNLSANKMGFFDLFAALSATPWMNVQLAFQVGVGEDTVPVAVLPALQFFPTKNLHIDLGARIAANDAGKGFSQLSRAMLVLGMGAVF